MARPGYIEAKNARNKALDHLTDIKARLVAVDSMDVSEGLKEVHRKDAQIALEQGQQAFNDAESTFAAFERPKPAERQYFEDMVGICLSTTKAMSTAIRQRCEQDHISKTELIRRALQAYLNPPVG